MADKITYKNCRIEATPHPANAPMDEWYAGARITTPDGKPKDVIARGTMISGRAAAVIQSIEIGKMEIDQKRYG